MHTLIAFGFVLLLGIPAPALADDPKGAPPAEAQASNLNLSKSNRNAEAGQATGDAKAAAPPTAGRPESERVRSKKSNSSD